MLLRLVASAFLIHDAFRALSGGDLSQLRLEAVAAATGLLLLIGLWTPIAGAFTAMLEMWIGYSQARDCWGVALAAAIALALALLGPGAWSVDARRYGRRRISIGER